VAPPPLPAGTRSVSLNNPGQSPGDFATLRNLTLNSSAGLIAVPPGTYGSFSANAGSGFVLGEAGTSVPSMYNFQNLTLNSNSTFSVVGPVVVTIDGGFSTNTNMGEPAHPEWLQLRIAGGGLSLAGNRTVYAGLEAPDGTLTLNGGSQFIGAVAVDRLIVNGNALLRITPGAAANQPPAVALVAPADGANLTAPADILLTATATDPDGSIARVEFYQGATKLGESVVAPYAFLWSSVGADAYSITARAIDNEGSAAVSAPHSITVVSAVGGLPFVAEFEPAEGYQPGPLSGQQDWTASGGVEVVSSSGPLSEQEVMLPAGLTAAQMTHVISASGAAPVFVDFFAQPVAGVTAASAVTFNTTAARVALVGMTSPASLQVFDGNAWLATGKTVAVDAAGRTLDWLRLTTREDYVTRKWDLYSDGRMIVADVPFVDNTATSLASFSVTGHATVASAFDDLYAGLENPIAADADYDGMDDAWETAHGLNPAVNDRNVDHDADGLTNIIEYVLGTKPDNIDSDGDGMRDGWEYQHGLKPLVNDAASDLDADGVTNFIEFKQGRNPTKGAVPDSTGVINLRVYQPGQQAA
jgi:hypothetical protein